MEGLGENIVDVQNSKELIQVSENRCELSESTNIDKNNMDVSSEVTRIADISENVITGKSTVEESQDVAPSITDKQASIDTAAPVATISEVLDLGTANMELEVSPDFEVAINEGLSQKSIIENLTDLALTISGEKNKVDGSTDLGFTISEDLTTEKNKVEESTDLEFTIDRDLSVENNEMEESTEIVPNIVGVVSLEENKIVKATLNLEENISEENVIIEKNQLENLSVSITEDAGTALPGLENGCNLNDDVVENEEDDLAVLEKIDNAVTTQEPNVDRIEDPQNVLPESGDDFQTIFPVENTNVLSDTDLPVISQVFGNSDVVEELQKLQAVVPLMGETGMAAVTMESTSCAKDNAVTTLEPIAVSQVVSPEKEKEPLPVITTPSMESIKNSTLEITVEKVPLITPSFEEIPFIKTEPQDIFIKDDVMENAEPPGFHRQSEPRAADVSLILDLEIDFNYCASCKLDFRSDSNETPKKLKSFASFNTVSGDTKTVSILEALLLIFDLRFVKCCTAFHKEENLLQDISLCTQCAIMATQMYKLYTEFSELIHAESILSKLVNHENVLQNNAIAKAAAAKSHAETESKKENDDFSENLPNIRVRNPSEKQRKGVTSIFESDNESDSGDTHEVINGLEGVRRNSLENRKKNIIIEKNRRISVCNDKPVILSVSSPLISSRLLKPATATPIKIKKEHGRLPIPIQTSKNINNVNISISNKFSQRPKRIFDIKQEYVPPRKIARGNSNDNSIPSIVSVHSIANPSIIKDEAQPCSSSSLQRSLRPKRKSCKIVDYSKQLGEESEVEDDDKDAEIFSEDEFDDDPDDPDFSRKSKPKPNTILGKCAKNKPKTKLSPSDIRRMIESERLLKELSLPNLFPLTCKICKKTFRDLVSLERHKKTHKTVSSFPCFICGIICWNQNVFMTHLGTHIPEKPFICDCCNAAFKVKGELDQHKLRHQDLIIFTCQQCKECFPSLMLLNRHEAAIHMKETSYICPMCPAVQFERSDWSKHILTHSPFKCTKCDLFFNPNELKVHVQAFHPTQPPQKLHTPQQTHSIFSDLLRAASQRINH